MILADKIIRHRKMNAWSQEELAEKMNVSRQAVSKWESAQTTPDLEKILQLSRLFGVTTDYLLKDELEEAEYTEGEAETSLRQVTLEEANAYLAQRQWAGKRIGVGVFLCILSPLCLLLLPAISQHPTGFLSENAAIFWGLAALFLCVAAAVALFLQVDAQTAPYRFLEEGNFELAYGVSGLVKEKQKALRPAYTRNNILGTFLCIFSPLPLLAGIFTESFFLQMLGLAGLLLLVGIAVFLFIPVGVSYAGMQRLLREGEFARKTPKKESSSVSNAINAAYWPLATVIYLVWSFAANAWGISWLVWVIAGVLYVPIIQIADTLDSKTK